MASVTVPTVNRSSSDDDGFGYGNGTKSGSFEPLLSGLKSSAYPCGRFELIDIMHVSIL